VKRVLLSAHNTASARFHDLFASLFFSSIRRFSFHNEYSILRGGHKKIRPDFKSETPRSNLSPPTTTILVDNTLYKNNE
jgi:hypothetical protein